MRDPVRPGVDDDKMVGDVIDDLFAEFLGRAEFRLDLFHAGDVRDDSHGTQEGVVGHQRRCGDQAHETGAFLVLEV